jgi:hypothetical protein
VVVLPNVLHNYKINLDHNLASQWQKLQADPTKVAVSLLTDG